MQFPLSVPPELMAQLFASMQPGRDSAAPKAPGVSRKHRMATITNPSGNPLAAMVVTTSPVMPLRFEMEKGWASNDYIGMEVQGLTSAFTDDYINPSVLKAQLRAYQAYALQDPDTAAAVARDALRISDLCPEAYNVLALTVAKTYEEALELYKKGTEVGCKVLRPGLWEDTLSEANMWARTPFRAHYRALYGVANTLRKMGRYQESLQAYDQLMELDPNWYQWSSYVNVFATYPLALLGAKGPEATLKWFKSYKFTADMYTYNSSALCYTATYCLAELMATAGSGRAVGKKATVTSADGWSADGQDVADITDETPWAAAQGGRSLMLLCMHYPDAVDMLLGDKSMPKGITATQRGPASASGAAAYVYTAGSLWRASSSALERLRKYRNTFELRMLLTDLSDYKGADIADIRHYMTAPGGFHKNSLLKTNNGHKWVCTLMDSLCGCANGKERSKDQLKVLKWVLDAGCTVHNDHPQQPYDSPIHMACYQGYGAECVKLLLEGGADVFRPNFQNMTAYEMTANQGNWRELQALFAHYPEHKSASAAKLTGINFDREFRALSKQISIPEALILLLFQSSCLPCLDGGERCMRCSMGSPHSQHADFFKYAEVVINECGLTQLHRGVLEQMQEMDFAHRAGCGNPWGRLRKHVIKNLAAAAAGGGGSKAITAASSNAPTAAAAAASNRTSSSSGASKLMTDVDKLKRQTKGHRFCWCCNAAAAGMKLKVCSGCRSAKYCSTECQNKDWKSHKAQCKLWKAEDAPAPAGN